LVAAYVYIRTIFFKDTVIRTEQRWKVWSFFKTQLLELHIALTKI